MSVCNLGIVRVITITFTILPVPTQELAQLRIHTCTHVYCAHLVCTGTTVLYSLSIDVHVERNIPDICMCKSTVYTVLHACVCTYVCSCLVFVSPALQYM